MLPRVIPILSIDGNKLVKTVKFKKPKYVGDPLNAIRIFNEKMIDEIAILDIRATFNKSEVNYQLIGEMAGECFSPLAYGGGIKNIKQVEKIFQLGIEKVILNSAAFETPELITEIADSFGGQSVVVCLDIKQDFLGRKQLMKYSGSKRVNYSIEKAIDLFQEKGAGEIIIQDVNREGTFQGFNTEYIESIRDLVKVPLVALGGCNGIPNMNSALSKGANAIAASSLFVFRNNDPNSIMINYPKYNIIKSELKIFKGNENG